MAYDFSINIYITLMTINYYNNNFYRKVFDDVLSKYKSKI